MVCAEAAFCDEKKRPSIPNPQQLLPLPEVTFEAHAPGNLKRRDQTALDLLAGLPGSLAR
jgi:hypothetical protein